MLVSFERSLILFSLAGFKSFLSSYRFILVVYLYLIECNQKLTLFFNHRLSQKGNRFDQGQRKELSSNQSEIIFELFLNS